jgi:hypothetical protein
MISAAGQIVKTLRSAIFKSHFWQGLPYHRVCLAEHDEP